MRRGAKNETVQELGGAPIPVDRRRLNITFWLANLGLVSFLVFFNDASVPLERLGFSLLLVAAIMLPTWLWVSGRSHGLPIYPLYCLSFFPTYAMPLCRGDSRFAQYTELQIANGVMTVAGFLFLTTFVWLQCTNRNLKPAPLVREIDPRRPNLMLFLLSTGLIFEVIGIYLGESKGGAYQAIRGYAQNASRLAIFILFYQIGKKELSPMRSCVVIGMTVVLVVRQAASIVLANSFPILGLGFAGFFMGAGKLPLKSLAAVVGVIVLLHSGKAEMRAIYYKEGVNVTLADYPAFFAEWMSRGVVGLVKGESSEGVQVQNAKERAALLPLLLQIQRMTGTEVPYLEGASYAPIPSMLVPRIITKDKAVSHISNMIMAVHYGILNMETVWFTSIAFDLVIEAYANFGYGGVAALSVFMGLFLGMITLGTTGVPLFSFRFLLGTLVLSAVVGSNNTMGVFITTSWQGFLALVTMGFTIMKETTNPLYVKPGALRKMEDGESEDRGLRAEGGPTSLQASPTREELRRVENKAEPEAASEKHARPTRYVYGKGKQD
jgi:hypothetical protein